MIEHLRGADGAAQLVSIARFFGTPIDDNLVAELLGCRRADLAALAAGHPARVDRLHLATLAAFADEAIAYYYELDFSAWTADMAALIRDWLLHGQMQIGDGDGASAPRSPRSVLADPAAARAALSALRAAS